MWMPDAGQSHLYKWMSVLGSFVLIASIYSMAVLMDAHNSRVDTIGRATFFSRDVSAEERQFWVDHLMSAKRGVEFAFTALAATGAIGLVIAIAGGILWYSRVQRYEDGKRRLENQKLAEELAERAKASRPLVIGSP
jgi:hypothetical protein